MNEWPADPILDARLKDLVSAELAAARADADAPTRARRRETVPTAGRMNRQRLAVAGVGTMVVLVIAGSLAFRGMRASTPALGPANPTGSPTETTGPSSSPIATPTATPIATPTPLPAQSPSPWFRTTGSMATSQPLSVLLTDGRVLFVGGFDPVVGMVKTVEVYDPATGTFSPTGSMTTARDFETVTTLRDGRVLVVGGLDADNQHQLVSAEIYDPATGKFTLTGSIHTARQFHTATLLADGRVLIAGGFDTNPYVSTNTAVLLAYHRQPAVTDEPWTMTNTQGQLNSAEIYDPATGRFTPTGSMTAARDQQTATLLSDGRVLMIGGSSGVATAEIYDPKTGKFSRTGSLKAGRWLHAATLLADGRVLVTGGRSTNDSIYSSAEIYDPRTGKFTAAGSMAIQRQEHTATLLSDGRVLIAGGFAGTARDGKETRSAEFFDPKTGKFSPAGLMTIARMDQTATLLADGRVLIAGGTNTTSAGWAPVSVAELNEP
jgi:hypothetical protein